MLLLAGHLCFQPYNLYGSTLLRFFDEVAWVDRMKLRALKAIAQLQAVGVIRSVHSYIEVLDRAGLERRTCECYGAVNREFDRLLSETQPHR